ncbi:MAG TPA: molybdenum cofactor biosynthesis protein MoaE [Longimicrobiales bacterium]|nr:molybdenum cofactor biosynthesis protein MoaE [Longimicrobiales bacterium]
MHAWITREPIGAEDVLRHVGAPSDGAVDVFLGIVRDENEGRAVSGMHYDAYDAMAERVIAEIVAEAAARPGVGQVAAVHRIGELRVGEVSVAIAASAPHRAEALAATRYVIEAIKQRLPVWKQEHYLTGEQRWLRGESEAARAG